MKNTVLCKVVILVFILGNFYGCSSSMENDAVKLARIQKQKNETVRSLLMCKDSEKSIAYLADLNQLESTYKSLKQECEIKYADSLDGEKFVEAFLNALAKEPIPGPSPQVGGK